MKNRSRSIISSTWPEARRLATRDPPELSYRYRFKDGDDQERTNERTVCDALRQAYAKHVDDQ